MCTAYYADRELERWLSDQENIRKTTGLLLHKGDFRPSDTGVVLVREQENTAVNMVWGIPGFEKGRPIVNARAETALAKPLFARSMRLQRCVIPVSGFYEWDRDKQKVTFTLPDHSVFFLAGCFQKAGDIPGRRTGMPAETLFGNRTSVKDGSAPPAPSATTADRYVILTTAANESMLPVHDRMPLLIPEDRIGDYLFDYNAAKELLETVPPQLSANRPYEQLSFF